MEGAVPGIYCDISYNKVNVPKTGEKGYGLIYGLAAAFLFAAAAVIAKNPANGKKHLINY